MKLTLIILIVSGIFFVLGAKRPYFLSLSRGLLMFILNCKARIFNYRRKI